MENFVSISITRSHLKPSTNYMYTTVQTRNVNEALILYPIKYKDFTYVDSCAFSTNEAQSFMHGV